MDVCVLGKIQIAAVLMEGVRNEGGNF